MVLGDLISIVSAMIALVSVIISVVYYVLVFTVGIGAAML